LIHTALPQKLSPDGTALLQREDFKDKMYMKKP
jgi:hypothetical protein